MIFAFDDRDWIKLAGEGGRCGGGCGDGVGGSGSGGGGRRLSSLYSLLI